MGILDYIDEEEYAAWQRAKKRDRQQQQQLAAQRYAQPEPTPWQQALQYTPPTVGEPIATTPPSAVPIGPEQGQQLQDAWQMAQRVGEVATTPIRLGWQGYQAARENVPGVAGMADLWGRAAQTAISPLAKGAEQVMPVLEGYSQNVTQPLAEAAFGPTFRAAAQARAKTEAPSFQRWQTRLTEGPTLGAGIAPIVREAVDTGLPNAWRRAQERYSDTPELVPGQKGIAEAIVDPLNVIGPEAAVPLVRAGARVAGKVGREVGPVAKAALRDMRLRPEAGELRLAGEAAEPVPTFYSQLERTLSEARQPKWQPGELRNFLKAQGVKDEELKWTGFDDYVLGRAQAKQPVTKDEALQFLRENQVQVEEIVKPTRPQVNWERLKLADRPGEVLHEPKSGIAIWPDEKRQYRLFRNGNAYGMPYATEQEAIRRAEEMWGPTLGAQPTKFSRHTLPGAQEGSYRELLLTLPERPNNPYEAYIGQLEKKYGTSFDSDVLTDAERAQKARLWEQAAGQQGGFTADQYRSPHFPELDILAHIRFNDRVDAAGKKTLFIEEIQSDLHQTGRQKGYRTGEYGVYDGRYTSSEKPLGVFPSEQAAQKFIDEGGLGTALSPNFAVIRPIGEVPNAPFAKTWPELALKRMVRWASENGYDRMAWTRGTHQAERYNMSKQLDALRYIKRSDGSYVLYGRKGGSSIIEIPQGGSIPANKLEDYVGKEVAQRIIEGAGEPFPNSTLRELSGLDLRVGGQGMLAFYDRELVNITNNLGKKFGARVTEAKIPGYYVRVKETNDLISDGFTTRQEALQEAERLASEYGDEFYIEEMGETVHSIDITPAMRESVVYKGQPLFMAPETVGGILGAATGYDPNATPEENAKQMALKGAIGVTGGHLVRPGAAQRLGQAAKALHLNQRGAIGDLEATSPIFQRANAIAERLSFDPDEPASIYRRISELEQELGGLGESTGIVKPTSGPMRMWGDDKLEAFAERTKRNPYQADWWDKVDTVDIKEFNDSWVPSGGRTARAQTVQQELAALRREEKALKAEYKTLSEAIMGERPAAEVLREKGLPVPGEEVAPAELKAVAPAKQAGMFQPGEARPQMKGAIPGEMMKPEDLLGGPQFEDEAARVKWEREQVIKAGQREMFGESPAGAVEGTGPRAQTATIQEVEAKTANAVPPLQTEDYPGGPIRVMVADSVHATEKAADTAFNAIDPNEGAIIRQVGDQHVVYRFEDAARGQTKMFGEGTAAERTAPQPAEVAKQPWEMTLAELNRTGYIAYDTATNQPFVKASASINEAANASGHSRAVAKALSEGKPVPEAVLADYPDLAAQYKGAGETVITEPTPLLPAEVAPAATGQGAVPTEPPLPLAPETPVPTEIAPTPKPAVDPLQAEYAKVLGTNPRIGQYMRYLNQTYVKTNSPLKGFATYLDDAGNVFVARNSKEGKLNYYRVDKTGKAVPVSKAGAEWREVGTSGEMPAGVHAEAVTEKPFAETAVKVIPEGYPANTTAKQLAYIENMQESLEAKKIAGVRVYMDNRGHLFVERISNGGKSYVQQLKLDGTARDVRKGANWTLLDENIREVARPTTQTKVPKPPRTDEEIEAAIRARQARARQPLWAQEEMQAKALETELSPAGTAGQGPPKPPAPPPETGPAPELPSGRRPGGIEKMTPAPTADPYQQLQDALTPDRPGVRDRLRDATNRFMRETYDRNYDLGPLEQLTGVPAHKLAQVVSGAVAAGEDRIRRFVLPVLETVGDDVKHLEEYMVLMRNQDVMARNPSAKLPGDIAGWAGTLEADKRLAGEIGQERFARVKAAAKDLWRVNDEQILRPLLDEGMLDQEAYRAMRAAHPHYIDFHRADFSLVDGVERVMTRPEASVSSLNIKRMEATGSTRKLDDPLARTAAQVIRTKVLISRNRAAKAIVTALLEREAQMAAELGVKELPEAQRLVKFLKATEAAEHSNPTDTISYFNKGDKVTVQVPPVYATIAKGLEGETAHTWERLVASLSAPLRYGAVRYNPLFVVVNPIRDAISAFYREGLVPMSSEYIRGWVAAIHKNADFTEAAEAGVLMSGIVDNMRSTEALARARRMGVVSVRDWRDALLVLPRLIERANLTAEQATRIATYHKLKGQGLSELEAAVRARDVTVDFAKSGNTMKVINQMLPFSNAGLQGAANTVRLIKDNPRQALIASSALAMPTIAAYLNNQRFETSKMIPDYEYVNSWVFQIGEGERKADPRYPDAAPEKFPLYVKIPKGPLGAFVTAPVELALRLAFAKDDRSVAEHFLEGAKTMATAISPLEPNVSAILPPLGGAAVGIATGQDLYRDAPIVPQREQNRPAELQYGPETSSLAVALGERFKVSPRMVEFAIKDYTAGVGSQALWLSDLALGALGYNPQAPGEAKQRPLAETEQLAKNPLVGRFLGTRNTQQERMGYAQLDRTVEQGRRDYMAIPEVRRLGMSLSPVSEAIKVGERDVEMSPAQRAQFQREYNETRITGVQAVIDSPLYQQAPSDKVKQAILERMNRKAGELTRDNAELVAQGQAPKLTPAQLQTEIREYVQALHENAQLLAIPKYRSIPPEKEKAVTSIESRVSAIKAAEPRYSPAGAENQARKEGRFSDEDWRWYMRAKGNLNPERQRFVREHPVYRKWFRGAAEEYLQLRTAS